MEKKRKNINLDKEVLQHIEKMRKESKFNFSEWVNSAFKDNFMNVEIKESEIEEYLVKIENLKQEIKEIDERNKMHADMLTVTERRFFRQIPFWLEKGCDLKSLCIRFNKEFNRSLTFEDFKKVYGVINGKRQ